MTASTREPTQLRTARRTDDDPGMDFLNVVPFERLYRTLARHACTQLELALGPRHGRTAIAAVLGSLEHQIFGNDARLASRIRDGDPSVFDEDDVEFDWQEIAAEFSQLFMFARHGDGPRLQPDESRRQIELLVAHFRRLVADPAVKAIVQDDFEWFDDTLAAADARWELDNGRPVLPDHLAALAGVKAKTLANLLASGQLPADGDGRIPAAEALQYLGRRKDFVRSSWQEPDPVPKGASSDAQPELTEQVFVPVDGDGGAFLPSLARRGRDGQPRYIVGEKADPRYVEDYWAALALLERMPTPRWRRPPASGAGGWSLVSAQDGWRRFGRGDLQRMVEAIRADG